MLICFGSATSAGATTCSTGASLVPVLRSIATMSRELSETRQQSLKHASKNRAAVGGIAYVYSPTDRFVVRRFFTSASETFCFSTPASETFCFHELLGWLADGLPRSPPTPLLTTMPVCNCNQSLTDIPAAAAQGARGHCSCTYSQAALRRCSVCAELRTQYALPKHLREVVREAQRLCQNRPKSAANRPTSVEKQSNSSHNQQKVAPNCSFSIVKQVTGPWQTTSNCK